MMRKGQIKILERARYFKYSDACIQILSREDLTVKRLEQICYALSDCRSQNDPLWLSQYLHLIEKEDIGRLIKLYASKNKDISYDDLLRMETAEQLCTFFSTDNVSCESLLDVEFIIMYGVNEHTDKLLQIARRFYDEFTASVAKTPCGWRGEWDFWRKMDKIVVRYAELSDYDEIWNGISFSEWDGQDYYLEDYIKAYFEAHCPFRLKRCQGIPKEISSIDFHGYRTRIQVYGYARFIGCTSKTFSFSVSPYGSIEVDQHGDFYVHTKSSHEKTVLFFHSTQEFVTAFHAAGSKRFRPTTLRDLFQSISISEDDEDDRNAASVIEYLCNRYQTFIFKDLYEDFLAWKCMLLPITIVDAAKYHSKKELFQIHYKMPISGDWNRKNANLSYMILKLQHRLSADGLARAMQCTNEPVEQLCFGRSQFRYARMLYSAVQSIQMTPTLLDAIKEEYDAKQLHLLPEAQTIHVHNERQRLMTLKKTPEVKIKQDTKFKRLIDEMPDEYELIQTKERICEETEMQHNCVRSYAQSISRDECMIYSVLYQGERHTIEIISNKKGNHYSVRQCLRACNRIANPDLADSLSSEIQRINRMNLN